MSKKILINGITLEGANIVPLLLKVKYWQERDVEITFFGNKLLKEQIDSLDIIKKYHFLELKNTSKINSRVQLIFEGLRRNIQALFYIKQIKNRFDVVYSVSSVLDLMIFPHILKKFDKKIIRVAVFDNIVPFTDPGNKVIRFLAWNFFQISLILLKSTDIIFTGSADLEYFLIRKGIDKRKIIERGQAVRNDLIKKSPKNPKYNFDALFIGRINETKGIYDMVEILAIVKQKYPNFQLALIGSGEEAITKRYKEKIKEMDLTRNIRFLGYVSENDKFDIIKSSRVFWFLSVSESESWGVALLEAVCCGKPAFTYNLPAFNYYKNNEIFSFPIGDYRAVAQKVIEVFDNEEFDNRAGKLLIDKYSWEKIAEIEYNNISSRQSNLLYQKNILINGITLEGANIIPLLSKIKYWNSKGVIVTIFGNEKLKQQIDSLNIIKKYNFIVLRNTNKITNRMQLIIEGIHRNFQALHYLHKLKNKFDVVYSISSVLDLLLFPYFLKKIDKKIKRVAVFDNTVPFIHVGNIFIRFLAWFFYQVSLYFLQYADYIFAVRPELKQYLLKKGFEPERIIATGNGIELGFIKSAKKDKRYNIDALYVGRINEMKGIYDMLKVLEIVKVKYPNFQLGLMGTGDRQTLINYKKKMEEMKLAANIQFLGYKTGQEKFDIIKSSKCFWFLSYTESFPVAPLEAVCCGLPVVVYNLDAYNMYKNREVIRVRKEDYTAAATKTLEIYSKKKLINKAGINLFHKISWSWDEIAEIEYKTLFVN